MATVGPLGFARINPANILGVTDLLGGGVMQRTASRARTAAALRGSRRRFLGYSLPNLP